MPSDPFNLRRSNILINPIPFIDFGGAGEVLHFAHPNAYTPETFYRFLTPFTEHYHVLGMKQRPLWPHTDPAELTDWTLFADDLIRFFDQEGLQNVIGVGHSSGAVATMLAAIKRPDLFSKLILIEPVFLPKELLKLASEHPEMVRNLPIVKSASRRRNQWPSRQVAFARLRTKAIFARFSDDLLWDYVNHSLGENEDGTISLLFSREWEVQIYLHFPSFVWDELPKVTQPTLGIRATETDTVFPDAWQTWQEIQPNATFVELAEVGHMLTLERPYEVANVILEFLQ